MCVIPSQAQLTLWNLAAFKKIMPMVKEGSLIEPQHMWGVTVLCAFLWCQEFHNGNWMKKQKSQLAPNLLAFTRQFNHVSWRVFFLFTRHALPELVETGSGMEWCRVTHLQWHKGTCPHLPLGRCTYVYMFCIYAHMVKGLLCGMI